MNGIDISAGSGHVDFRAAKENGVDFVIVRAGFGSAANQRDARFDEYVERALAAGLHVGAYWFVYARTFDEADVNAYTFLDVVKKWHGKLDMPLYIDYEYDSTRYYEQETGKAETRETATEYIRRATQIIEDAGYYAGAYLNYDYIKNRVNYTKNLDGYTLWYAQWGVDLPSMSCGIWQKSGDVKKPFAAGNVDENICFIDFPSVIRAQGLNGFKPNPNVSNKTGTYELTEDGEKTTIVLR